MYAGKAPRAIDRFALHELQRPAVIGDAIARDPVAHAVTDARLHFARKCVLTIHAYADDHVRSVALELLHHLRDVRRIVLQIGVERYDEPSARRAPTGVERGSLSAVF